MDILKKHHEEEQPPPSHKNTPPQTTNLNPPNPTKSNVPDFTSLTSPLSLVSIYISSISLEPHLTYPPTTTSYFLTQSFSPLQIQAKVRILRFKPRKQTWVLFHFP